MLFSHLSIETNLGTRQTIHNQSAIRINVHKHHFFFPRVLASQIQEPNDDWLINTDFTEIVLQLEIADVSFRRERNDDRKYVSSSQAKNKASFNKLIISIKQ